MYFDPGSAIGTLQYAIIAIILQFTSIGTHSVSAHMCMNRLLVVSLLLVPKSTRI